MAPSSPAAAESSPTATATAEGQRVLPTPFLSKTYQLVEDSAVDDVISWNSDGSAFVVWRPAEFARDLLPKCFKHNNFSSFVRQLNTYGFRKIVPDRWEFSNDCFRRGERRLLCDIHRRKITSPAPPPPVTVAMNPEESAANSGDEQVLSSNSSPTTGTEAAPPDLAADNERLRKENLRLARELGQMKNLCNNIYVLISKYSGGGAAAAVEVSAAQSSEMELFPAGSSADPEEKAEADASPNAKLFGFPIRTKRVRQEEEKEEDPIGEVKLEPDTWTDPKDDGAGPGSWALYCTRPDARTCNR